MVNVAQCERVGYRPGDLDRQKQNDTPWSILIQFIRTLYQIGHCIGGGETRIVLTRRRVTIAR